MNDTNFAARLALWGALACIGVSARAELIVPGDGSWAEIGFEQTVEGVNRDRYDGSGLGSVPSGGQLDSDSWMFSGFSDGATVSGQASNSGDYARGLHTGGVTTGGLYAFATSADNRVLGVQSTGSDFSPGWIQLSARAPSTRPLWDINFDWWVFNDKPRSTQLEVSVSNNATDFVNVPLSSITTGTSASTLAAWQASPQSIQLSFDEAVDQIWIRWAANDAAGTGSRDEFGIDNIAVRAVDGAVLTTHSTPEPGSVTFLLLALAGVALARWWAKKPKAAAIADRRSGCP